jgi:hypothetical protein
LLVATIFGMLAGAAVLKHAVFCRKEAARRYNGKLAKDQDGMLVVKDKDGHTHRDGAAGTVISPSLPAVSRDLARRPTRVSSR